MESYFANKNREKDKRGNGTHKPGKGPKSNFHPLNDCSKMEYSVPFIHKMKKKEKKKKGGKERGGVEGEEEGEKGGMGHLEVVYIDLEL